MKILSHKINVMLLGENLHDLGFGDEALDTIPKEQNMIR